MLYFVKVVVQILLLTFAFYRIYTLLVRSQAQRYAHLILLYGVVFTVVWLTGLTVLEKIMKFIFVPFIVFVTVLFQAELKRTFITTVPFEKRSKRKNSFGITSDEVDKIMSACHRLVDIKRGALIVFPRKLQLKTISERGVKLDADISTELIVSVFDHDTPLHDGAMIISNSKIESAGCYLPLSQKSGIETSFGTRHRAALGLAEESDAMIIVVSEETGAISLAYDGELYYQLSDKQIRNALLSGTSEEVK